ncbi:MAG: archaellin/type IV pilin N-terminal domain-containing protein [Thermoplasmata archaeon]
MNVIGENARRWRKTRQRGVSPIIATILLVAITVVLAAVLYVLVSGLTRSGASTPYSLGMTAAVGGQTGSGANWFDQMALSPSSGLTTTMFGLTVTNPSGVTYALAPAVGGSGCTLGVQFAPGATGCNGPAAASWYGLILSATGAIQATYLLAGGVGTWTYNTGTTIALNSGYTLEVISFTQLTGNDYTISAFSTGTSSVSGSGTL